MISTAKALMLSATLLFVLGFTVAAMRGNKVAQWLVGSLGKTTQIVATNPLDGVTFRLRLGLYAGLVLAAGPLASLFSGITLLRTAWAVGFALLSLTVSTVSVLSHREQFSGFAAALSTMQPDLTSVISLEALPLGRMLLPGPALAISVALVLRWLTSKSDAQPPPLPGRA